MDKETDKKLDEFTGKLLNEFSSETTSFDFTRRVMTRVEGLSKSRAVEYRPLISKESWMFLGVVVASVFLYLVFGDVKVESSFTSYLNRISLPKFSSFTIPDYNVSDVLLYAITGFTFFIGVQIYLLRGHFNKRYT